MFPTFSWRRVAVAILTGLTACGTGTETGPGTGTDRPPLAIVVDGEFSEWATLPTVLSDPADAPNDAAVDLGAVQAHSDGRFLYLTLETGRQVNAQAMRGAVQVLIDADGDPETGVPLEDVEGVDLVLELSRQDQLRDNGYGAGIGIRIPDEDGGLGAPASAGLLDVIVAPTSAASRFEIRISRYANGPLGAVLADDAALVQVVHVARGEILDRTDVAPIDLVPLSRAPLDPWTEPIGPADGTVRVAVWNVSSESFRDRPERFARVLAGIGPHVVLLDEVFGAVTPSDIDDFLAREPLRSLGDWEYVLGRSGGRQKTLVASRIGIRAEPAMQDLPYPPASIAALAEAFPGPQAQRLFGLERERGLASTGAWVTIGSLPVLFVPIDLQSAGYAGSFEDELRKLQARTLRDRVAAVLSDAGEQASAVIGGDLNLVGSRDPLDILVHELDRGGADLVPADARRLTDGSYATWRNSRAPFTPGRLDFLLVPERALRVERAIAFDASELSSELRESLGIAADDPTTTSDHLPVVVDLAPRGPRP